MASANQRQRQRRRRLALPPEHLRQEVVLIIRALWASIWFPWKLALRQSAPVTNAVSKILRVGISNAHRNSIPHPLKLVTQQAVPEMNAVPETQPVMIFSAQRIFTH